MNRTDRLLAIVLELQAKGWQRAEDLAATFEISKRTIYRDLLALSETGVPVVASPGKGYRLDEGYFLPPLHFTPNEATLLLLGADFITQTFDDEYQRDAAFAATKIYGVLTERQRGELEPLRAAMRLIAINPLADEQRAVFLARLRRAILESRRIRFVYHTRYTDDSTPAGEIKERDADPYALVHYGNAWYLTAYCYLRNEQRSFRVDRIDALTLLKTTFKRPVMNFDNRMTPGARAYVARVRFAPEVARWVLEDRSFYVAEALQDETGLHVTLHARRDEDILQWLLSWGRHVQVLQPDSLRQRFISEARAILETHERAESLLP